jgi:acetyltransferase
VIRVGDTDEVEDLAKAFLNLPPMKGKGVAVITGTGGGGIMAIDQLEKHNLRLARLSAETLDRMNTLAPDWLPVNNPVDIWPSFMVAGHPLENVFVNAVEACLNDEDVSGVILIFSSLSDAKVHAFVNRTEALPQITDKFRDKPILVWVYGDGADREARRLERDSRVLVYPTLERAARTLSRLNQYWEYRQGT